MMIGTDVSRRPSVLVVDDENEILEEMIDALSDEGLSVLGAGSVDEALAAISTHAEIEIIVTDLRMPGRLGTDLIHEASKTVSRKLRFILVTGHGSGRHDVERSGLNVFSVLHKPIGIDVLIETVGKALDAN
jgi:DNA-binding NtrC family response regulator